MKLVVAGLSPRDEAAFGFFMGRSMKSWSWEGAPAGRGAVLPEADVLVADLVSLGLGQWSDAAEADLLRALHGTPAVLLVPANDRSWATMDAGTVEAHSLVFLSKPYGTEGMRVALEKAAEAARRAVPRAAPKAAPVAAPVAPVVPASAPAPLPLRLAVSPVQMGRPLVSVSAPAVARPAAAVADEVPGLTAVELQARLAKVPDEGRHVFLRKLAEMLHLRQPFEARFTVHNSVIFHPADGWVASNTPMMVIERVCKSDAMASAVAVREIDGPQAEERTHRLGMPLRELDTFLWELAAASLDLKPSPARPGS